MKALFFSRNPNIVHGIELYFLYSLSPDSMSPDRVLTTNQAEISGIPFLSLDLAYHLYVHPTDPTVSVVLASLMVHQLDAFHVGRRLEQHLTWNCSAPLADI